MSTSGSCGPLVYVAILEMVALPIYDFAMASAMKSNVSRWRLRAHWAFSSARRGVNTRSSSNCAAMRLASMREA